MSNYSEKFEKMRIAGKLASKTLDMLTEEVKAGVTTDRIDQLGYEFIRDRYLDAKKSGVNFLAYRCSLNSKEIKIEKKIKILDE